MKQLFPLYELSDQMIALLGVNHLQQFQQIRVLRLLQNSSLLFHSFPILLSLDLPLHYNLNRHFLASRPMHCFPHLAESTASKRAAEVIVKEAFRHFRTCGACA